MYAEQLLDLLQKSPTVKDGKETFTFKNGTIDFDHVGFSYDGKKETIKDFRFHVGPGQKVALVGETGGGKSTILKLLFRFYDVSGGQIAIDGQDVRDVTLQSLRRCLGVVPQDPELFNISVIENVRYSKLEASDEEVKEACRKAAIHDKIMTFTNGYQTRVGEKGVKLSGGELQRIAIARVLLKNPAIVLLDEATSAVDTETESHIQAALQELTNERTTITIAHRLSTIINADVIIVVKDGSIVESGSPQDLLKAKGKFSELWLKQVGINTAPKDEPGADSVDEMLKNARDEEDAGATSRLKSKKTAIEGSSSSNKSLRPTAPEFVPFRDFVSRSQRGKAPKDERPRQDQSDVKVDHGNSSLNGNDGTVKHQQGQKTSAADVSDGLGYESQWDTCDSRTDRAKAPSQKKRMKPLKRRRKNNRSDPTGSSSRSSQQDSGVDGAGKGSTRNIPGEEAEPQCQPRHVSAPGGLPSSGDTVAGSSSAGRRRARGRHNKIEQRNSSGEGSGALSGDTLHPPTLGNHSSTSQDGSGDTNGLQTAANGAVTVRFAPEA